MLALLRALNNHFFTALQRWEQAFSMQFQRNNRRLFFPIIFTA